MLDDVNEIKKEDTGDDGQPKGEEAINIEDLHLSFGKKQVLKGVNFKVKRGDIVAIMGPSGCGKSTLTKIISGLLKPDKGKVQTHSEKIALAFQQGALFTSLSLYQNIDIVLKHNTDFDRKQRREKIGEVLDLVGLGRDTNAFPAELSGGMLKRAGIARALAIEPDLMMYDEPSAGLDPILSRKLDQDLRDLNDKLNMTTLVVTHDLDSVRNMTNRVVMLYQGEVKFQGTSEEFFSGDNEYAVQFREGREEGPFSITSNGKG